MSGTGGARLVVSDLKLWGLDLFSGGRGGAKSGKAIGFKGTDRLCLFIGRTGAG